MPTLRQGPAVGLDIEAYRGDTFRAYIQIKRNGVEEVLSTSNFEMHIRNAGALIFTLAAEPGTGGVISVEQLGGGSLILSITAEQMQELPTGIFVYDIQQTYPDGRIKTRVKGSFTIVDDITK